MSSEAPDAAAGGLDAGNPVSEQVSIAPVSQEELAATPSTGPASEPPAPSPGPIALPQGSDLSFEADPSSPLGGFHAPPVVEGFGETSVAERLSSSLSELQTRVSSLVQDSSSSVSRALKNVVPAGLGRKSPYPMIVAFGDSITQRGVTHWRHGHENERGTGWLVHLGHYFEARADVIARGFSGYNTRMALHTFANVMAGLGDNATVVLIWFGANDSVVRGRGGQYVSVEEYGLHLAKLVFEVKNIRKISPIVPVLLTPPPVQDEMLEQQEGSLPRRENRNTERYTKACAEIAARMEVPCIDLYNALSKHAKDQNGLKKFLSDGLHLSGEGNEFVGKYVAKSLAAQIPGFANEDFKKWFPDWSSVDMNDPAASFRRAL